MSTSIVLDASALIAMIDQENGGNEVADAINHSCMCSVNFAEVVTYYAHKGLSFDQIDEILRGLPMEIVSADQELSWAAGMLRPETKRAGLSLGDRYCLALAKSRKSEVLTADQKWGEIADVVKVKMRFIR